MMLLEVLCFLIGNIARKFETKMFSVQNAKYALHSDALGKRIVSWSFHVWLFSEESACLLWIVSTWINSHLAYWHMIQINIRLTAEPMSAKTKLNFCFIRLFYVWNISKVQTKMIELFLTQKRQELNRLLWFKFICLCSINVMRRKTILPWL